MNLLNLLKADLDRQYELAGSPGRANFWRIAGRTFHPRFLPLVLLRTSQELETRRIPVFPQVLSYLNLILFGIEVAPKCSIGPGLFLPHTVGTVIGAWSIGRDVTIFQNVTLGAKTADMGWNMQKRPSVGDGVTLGAGCKILGFVHLGAGSIVGANAVVLNNVPENVTVVGIPATIVRSTELPGEGI
jgi:serine O-acetyltransferase